MGAARILVVDDNRRIHRDFRKILEPAPKTGHFGGVGTDLFSAAPTITRGATFEIDSAHQGQEGLKLVERALDQGRPYQVAFVDVRMPPGWDGIETVRRIWEVDPNVQVVLCTAYSDDSWERTLDTLGAIDQFLILRKPFDAIEVQQLAHSLAEKWRLRCIQTREMAALTDQVQQHHTALNTPLDHREHFANALERGQQMEAVGELASGVAHEINTPVQFVCDSLFFIEDASLAMSQALERYADLIERADQMDHAALRQHANDIREEADLSFLQTELPDAVERARTGVDRVTEIVQTLRHYAHPGNDTATTIDLNRAVRNAVVVTRNQYQYAADLKTQLHPDLHVVCITGDLDQILVNLIVNAAYAIQVAQTDPTQLGALRVSTHIEGNAGIVRISDSGVGIPPDIQHRIFEPFFSTKETGRGTGQGLAIVKRLADRNGCKVEFESQLGIGTTFSVRIPLERA